MLGQISEAVVVAFVALGGLAALVFLRTLALFSKSELDSYEVIRKAAAMRIEYETRTHEHQKGVAGKSGAFAQAEILDD
jgi:hypothetical protein